MHPVWNWYIKANQMTKDSYFDDRKRRLTKAEFVSMIEIIKQS
jgi:hypothetical protein